MLKGRVFLALLLTGSAAHAQSSVSLPDTLDAYIEHQMQARRIPGLALAIARNGTVVGARGYGLADVQNGSPVTADTRFELASLTKQFTAAGILVLVQDGKIDLDVSISRYLPDIPEAWRSITTRQLLTHTSGLPPLETGFSGFGIVPANITTEDAYNAARADTLYFQPGEHYMYSDVGYFLLGMITEAASGIRWREFVQQRIFEPLAMTQTYVLDQFRIHPNEARGYTIRDGELQNIRRIRQFETPSHFGIFSNVLDLVKWDAALNTHSLLIQASATQMLTPASLNDGTTYPYGFGWQVWSQRGHTVQRHAGITGTEIVRLPDDTLVIVVLTNLGGPSPAVNSWGIAMEIAEMLVPTLNRGVLAASPIAEDELRLFPGDYAMVGGVRARVYIEDRRLKFAPAAAPVGIELVYQGGLVFELATVDRWLTFERDRTGNVAGFTLFTAGGAAPRKFARVRR